MNYRHVQVSWAIIIPIILVLCAAAVILNGLFIVGTAPVICPIRFDPREVRLALGFSVVATLLTFPRTTA